MITKELLNELFEYDENSGNFYWKVKRRGVKQGQLAGSKHSEGYVVIGINKKIYFAHRLAWIYKYGDIPEKHDIDHIDNNRSNNKISNLRPATRWQNLANSNHSSGKSKHRGVWFHKLTGTWQSIIRVNGVAHSVGYFHSEQEAATAYLEKSRELRKEFSK